MKLDAPAFDLDGQPVTLGMVLAVGLISGRLQPAFMALRDDMAADAFLDATGNGLGGPQLTPHVNAWRNAHGLSSAELTQRWLAAHEVELGDLVAYVSRKMARGIVGDRIAEARAQTPAPMPQVMASFVDHLLFDDQLEPQILDVAMRSVIDPPAKPAALEVERRALVAEMAQQGGVEMLGQVMGLDAAQLARVVDIQSCFRLSDRVVCAPDAVEREIKKNARGLVKVEYARAAFAEEGVALEVVASLRGDRQMWLEQLAHQLEVEPIREEKYVDDLTGSVVATKLATGQTGEVIGPERVGDAFRVYEVLGRTEPSADDPKILERIQDRLRKRAHAAAIERRIRFRLAGA